MQSQLFTVIAHEAILARVESFALGVSLRDPELSARTELELQNLCWSALRSIGLALHFRDLKRRSCLREFERARIPPAE